MSPDWKKELSLILGQKIIDQQILIQKVKSHKDHKFLVV